MLTWRINIFLSKSDFKLNIFRNLYFQGPAFIQSVC